MASRASAAASRPPATNRAAQHRQVTAFWPLWLASLLVPLLCFAGGAWWSWRVVEAETRARLVRAIDVQREHALRVFETQEAILAAVQARLRGMGWDEIALSTELHAFLRQVDESAPGTSGAGIVAPDGRLVQLSSSFPAARLDLSHRDYVQAHRDGAERATAFVGAAMLSGLTQRLLFALSRPRLDEAGRPDGGVLWATVRPADLQAFYVTLAEGAADTAVLLRADGAVLARQPALAQPVGQHLPAGSRQRRLLEQALRADGAVLAESESDLDGERRLFAARRVGSYPVVVLYGLHPSVPRALLLRHLAVLGSMSGVLGAVLLWLTWTVRRQAGREAEALQRERDALEAARVAAELRADAEAALRDGQRLEALGRLSAGVAHDFRNVVQAVQGGARLIQQAAVRDPGRVHGLAEMVAEAAARGAELTSRMLAVARGPGEGPRMVAPRPALEAVCGILRAALGGRHGLRCAIAEDLPPAVRGDRAELEAAIMNLAINARDALPDGGEIRVEAAGERDPPGLPAGDYLRVAVVDAGIGMDGATLARATQAFFTTKPRGQGTGLGLSTVRAFAEGTGGRLHLDSAPGQGTRVTIWLPAA